MSTLRLRTTLAAALLMLPIGCRMGDGRRLNESVPPGIARHVRDTISQVLDTQVEAWNNGDVEAFMHGYWHDPELTFLSGGKVTPGWEPTLERYKARYPDRQAMGRLTFSELHIDPLSADAAAVWGRWHLERGDSIGGLFTLVFRKRGDAWVIVHDHTSIGEP